jgi:chromosomal replication initiator protein
VVSTGDFAVTGGFFSIPLQVPAAGVRARRGSDKSTGPSLREFIGDEQNYLVPLAADAALLTVPRFNPIVFYGPTGTGKTFLARGLVQLANSKNPQRSAVITNGADFARDYANAVVTNSLPDFRHRLRSPAMLMVDDLDRLRDKIPAQNELITTLDELCRSRCQVLVTMKAAPLETDGLVPGLASRLSGGLAVPITTPGQVGRQAILTQLLKLRGVKLTDEGMQLLVRSPLVASAGGSPTFTELNQLVISLTALTVEGQTEFGVADLRPWLAEQHAARAVPLHSITRQVSKYFRLHVGDLKGPTRQQRVVRARGVAMFLARQWTGKSLEQLGQHYGNRDHTTVLHALRKTEELIATDPAIRQAVDDLNKQLATR